MAATGTELAQLYPDMTQTQEVAITYYVNSDYVPKLQKGQSVRLTLDKLVITVPQLLENLRVLIILPRKQKGGMCLE